MIIEYEIRKDLLHYLLYRRWSYRQIRNDPVGIYSVHKVGEFKNDQIVWFSCSQNDLGTRITEEFLLKKLEELDKSKVYDNPYTTTCDPARIFRTIKC